MCPVNFRITSFITTFISLERCLCITFPLKVKGIITPVMNKVIITSIFAILFIVFAPFYFANRLEWRYNKARNKTILTLVQTSDSVVIESITFPIHSVGMSTLSLLGVIVCTAILVVTLNRKAKWRQTSVALTKQGTTSLKEKKVVKMVTIISVIFIICFIPGTIVFFFMAYEPEFNFGRKYNNIGVMVWAVVLFMETVNSSANIFVYYNMSSKFRDTLIRTLCNSFEAAGQSSGSS